MGNTCFAFKLQCYIGSFLICYFGFLLFTIFKSGRKLQIILQFFSLPAHFSFVDKRASETRSPRPLVNESILRHSFLSEFQPGSPTLYPPCTFRLKLTQASTHIARANKSENYFSQSFRNVSWNLLLQPWPMVMRLLASFLCAFFRWWLTLGALNRWSSLATLIFKICSVDSCI